MKNLAEGWQGREAGSLHNTVLPPSSFTCNLFSTLKKYFLCVYLLHIYKQLATHV